ncbi:hypothetical protein QAD02_010040 [Eretmocerus hayati]|uniref:Uncharacterized protein n=1 Tax=Eretmocerus hayati TaxID=131215 RepID=A0ACC2NBA9_9HYME|nr:hypothetical protein QAD02_010040 [Eretmocerus hayati]
MDCLTLLLISLLILTWGIAKAFQEWQFFRKRGIPCPMEIPFLGSVGYNILFGPHANIFMKKIEELLPSESKYIGVHRFGVPMIFVRDIELYKSILIKNFNSFTDRAPSHVSKIVERISSKTLLFGAGDKWRNLRNLVIPTFSSSKMRSLFSSMSSCAENFSTQLLRHCGDIEGINFNDAFDRYALDILACCCFGFQSDSVKDRDNPYTIHASRASKFSAIKLFKLMLINDYPWLARWFGIRLVSQEDTDYLVELIRNTVKIREESGTVGPDMLQVMIDAKKNRRAEIDAVQIAGMALNFLLAGLNTTSSPMALISYELAINPDIQKKLQIEIDEAMQKCNGNPSYELIRDGLPYMEAVFNEGLRKYPTIHLNRTCTEEFELPPALPGGDPVKVQPGQEFWFLMQDIFRDPKHFPQPDKFDPERFIDPSEHAKKLSKLSWGWGPRMCPAVRLITPAIKVMFFHLLHKCSFEPCQKTPKELKYSRMVFSNVHEGGLWLKIVRRC